MSKMDYRKDVTILANLKLKYLNNTRLHCSEINACDSRAPWQLTMCLLK